MSDQPRVREITPAEAQELIDAGAALIDTREVHEWKAGHLAGATLIPPIEVADRIATVVPDKSKPVVVYCAAGARSMRAAILMAQLGYRDVSSVNGGIGRWKAEGRPWELPSDTPAVATNPRYARHLVMPEVGPEGQGKLQQAKVLFIGAGGLGSPSLLYLAAAGVGTIGIVDFDVVDLSNLQRQVIHADNRIGMKKTESAAMTIKALNPEVKVVQHDEMLTDSNVDRLICRLRPGHRRHGHVRDALLAQRRRRARGNPGRACLGLPLRGPADRLRALRGTVLSLPVPDAAAARAGARLLGGRRAWRRARRDGPAAGDRGSQADPRHRRPAGGPAAHLGRARRHLHRARAPARPELPGVWRERCAQWVRRAQADEAFALTVRS